VSWHTRQLFLFSAMTTCNQAYFKLVAHLCWYCYFPLIRPVVMHAYWGVWCHFANIRASFFLYIYNWISRSLVPSLRNNVHMYTVFRGSSTAVVMHLVLYINNKNIYLLQLGCHPVAVVILHVYKTWYWLLLNLSWEGYMRSM